MNTSGAKAPDDVAELQAQGLSVAFQVQHCTNEEELIAAAGDADIVFGRCSLQPFSRRVIEKLSRCRAIISMGIGFENIDLQAATRPVYSSRIPGFLSGRGIGPHDGVDPCLLT